jgi:aerobic carbon-monoxide dehydrogenase medium subunit
MKPVAFDYARPASVPEALRILAGNPEAKIMAGGQTLGPMLNMRLAQPALIVDITRIPELAAVTEEADAVTFGAIVTHAAIEDGRTPDPTGGFLRRVAAGIGYRAVRTRGTIGGSLAHADPAADWLSCLTALGAQVVIAGAGRDRLLPVAGFVRGALETELGDGELIRAIRVPRFGKDARFGFHKICRKQGEFAEAIGVCVHDPERVLYRLAASTAGGAPIVMENTPAPEPMRLGAQVRAAGFSGDDYDLGLSAVALRRAIAMAAAP